MQNIIDFPSNRRIFEAFWISIEFDIFRYVLIFLMIFGHNLDTKERSYFVVDQLFQR